MGTEMSSAAFNYTRITAIQPLRTTNSDNVCKLVLCENLPQAHSRISLSEVPRLLVNHLLWQLTIDQMMTVFAEWNDIVRVILTHNDIITHSEVIAKPGLWHQMVWSQVLGSPAKAALSLRANFLPNE